LQKIEGRLTTSLHTGASVKRLPAMAHQRHGVLDKWLNRSGRRRLHACAVVFVLSSLHQSSLQSGLSIKTRRPAARRVTKVMVKNDPLLLRFIGWRYLHMKPT
jgi:hypothetical protein